MLGMMLLGFAVFITIISIFMGLMQGDIVETVVDMPTFYTHDQFGQPIREVDPSDLELVELLLDERRQLEAEMANSTLAEYTPMDAPWDPSPIEARINEINAQLSSLGYTGMENILRDFYWSLGIPAIIILCVLAFVGATGHFWERSIGLWSRGKGQRMMRESIIGILVIVLLPEIWDPAAIMVEEFALYMFNPDGDPQLVVDYLWCKLGAAGGCIGFSMEEVLDPVAWGASLTNPNDLGQNLLGHTILPFMKLLPAFAATLSVYIVAKARLVFIMIVLLTIPVWMVARNLPILSSHSNTIIHSLVGASIAPIFSALSFYVGYVYLSNVYMPSLESWIAAVGIVTLAGAWPTILSPFLSRVSSSAERVVSEGIHGAMRMSQSIGMGLAGGALAAAHGGRGAAKFGAMAMAGGMTGGISAVPGVGGQDVAAFQQGSDQKGFKILEEEPVKVKKQETGGAGIL